MVLILAVAAPLRRGQEVESGYGLARFLSFTAASG